MLLLVKTVRRVHAALVQDAARRQLWPSQVTDILMYRFHNLAPPVHPAGVLHALLRKPLPVHGIRKELGHDLG